MAAAFAHDPITTKLTWSREVSRLFLKRCMTCHQAGGSAPFALTTYEEARPWAVAIRDEVTGRTMPPWGAVKGFGDFANDKGLTQEEINLIAEWAEGGAPEGDPNLLPPKPRKFPAPIEAKGRSVAVPIRLETPLLLTAIRARAATQVTVELPDGTVEPLLWLMLPLKEERDFILRQPLTLPAGTLIQATAPAVAIVTTPSRSHQKPSSSLLPHAQTAPRHGASPAAEK